MGDVRNRGTKDRPMWYCRYIDSDGKRKHRPTHQPTKALAMRFVAEVEARVARGQAGIPELASPERQGRTMTLIALANKFLKDGNPPSKNPEDYKSWLRYMMGKHVLPDLGVLPVALLRPAQVEMLRDRKLADGYKPATVNSMLKAISVLFIWSKKQGLYEGSNPTSGLRKQPPAGLIDYLSRDEVSRLLAYAQAHAPAVYPMIATAIYTGMRKGELFGLRWVDIAFDRGVIHVAHSYGKSPKSGKWRPVPLHPDLAPILRDLQSSSSSSSSSSSRSVGPDGAHGLIFPVIPERGHKARMGTADDMLGLEQILAAAGCHALVRPWHAMRHTFASHYVMAGGNLLALQKILGHSKFEMTQIYSHLAPDYMAAEIARMSFGPPASPPPTVANVVPLSPRRLS